MSIRIMTAVWEHSDFTDARAMLTLLALADWCNDKGVCWPSIATLAKKSRQSERNTRYILRKLQREDYVQVLERRGRNHCNVYRLNLQRLQVCEKEKLQSGDQKLQGNASKPATAIADKPSVNHQEKANQQAIEKLAVRYMEIFGLTPNSWTLTPLRMQKGLQRLKECLEKTGEIESAVHLMESAMDGLRRSAFHNGANATSALYNSWEKHLFGSCEQTERWMSKTRPSVARPDMLEELRKQRRALS